MKKSRILFLFSLVLSALFIGLASKSSPLYPLNDWVDVNCFFTMGRSMLDGFVPYRDLYEQKGPVLYFVYAIISLFSRDSFVGVYLLEVITYGLFLYFSGKVAQLYLGKSLFVFLIVAVLAALLPVSWSFTHGGSVEQNCLFMLVYGMYSVLRALREKRGLRFYEAFVNGIFAAIILWSKYTALGFYLGLALFVLIWYVFVPELRGKLMLTIGQFLLGIVAVSSIVFLYFGINNAIDDLFTVYFYNNIVLYPAKVDGSRLDAIWMCLKTAVSSNQSYGWMIHAGLFWFVFQLRNQWRSALMAALCFAGLTLGTYWGGRGYDYYGFIFAAFCVFGLIILAQALQFSRVPQRLFSLFSDSWVTRGFALALSMLLLFMWTLPSHHNLYLSRIDKDSTVQYRFAEKIQTVENPTLLNYGFLDGGFYFAADAKPACRYFCYFNINSQEMWDEQRKCIENGDADFIVTRQYKLTQYTVDHSKYQLVDTAEHPFDKSYKYTYYLYQKISD